MDAHAPCTIVLSGARHAIALDAEGLGELGEAIRRWQNEIEQIERRAADRLSTDGARSIAAGVVLLMFEASPLSGDTRGAGGSRPAPRAHEPDRA